MDKCIHLHIQAIVGQELDKKGYQVNLVNWTGYDDETWELEDRLIADSPEHAVKKIRDYKEIITETRTHPSKRVKRNQ